MMKQNLGSDEDFVADDLPLEELFESDSGDTLVVVYSTYVCLPHCSLSWERLEVSIFRVLSHLIRN